MDPILTDRRIESDETLRGGGAEVECPGRYAMQDELSGILGRDVDLVTRAAVEGSRNYIRRKAILESSQVVYAT